MCHPYSHKIQAPLPNEELERLAADLRQHGQREAILVRASATPDRAEILLGETVWQAAQHARLGRITLHYRADLNDDHEHARRLVEADRIRRTHRNAYAHTRAVARLFHDLLGRLPHWEAIHPHLADEHRRAWAFMASWARNASPTTRPRLATQIGCGLQQLDGWIEDIVYALDAGTLRSLTTNRGGLLDLPTEVREALQAERIGYKHALTLRHVKDPATRARLLARVVAADVSLRVLAHEVRASAAASDAQELSPQAKQDLANIRQFARDIYDRAHARNLHLTHNQRQALLAGLRRAHRALARHHRPDA